MNKARAAQLRIFVPFALGYFLSFLYRTINAVIGPDLAGALGIAPAALGLLTAAYFITFATFQLPLGVLLDRYGPRRVEAGLLLIAAAGALVFARADSLTGLVVGRGLIGWGVSACLMAAFKAYVLWFPGEQLPRINGYQLAAGGLGALAATAPVEAALAFTDWRGVFMGLALLTLAAAAAIFYIVPPERSTQSDTSWGEQFRGLGQVLSSPAFWRIAPWTAVSQATFLAVQGLWAGPWLRDVAGLERDAGAHILLLLALAMTAGFICSGSLAARLARSGIGPMITSAAGMAAFMVAQLLLIVPLSQAVTVRWMLFGFLGTTGVLSYAALSQSFPAHLAGRANTALNLLAFVGAFGAQWGIGAVIQSRPTPPGGGYAADAYPVAFMLLLGLQLVTALWYLWSGRRERRASSHS